MKTKEDMQAEIERLLAIVKLQQEMIAQLMLKPAIQFVPVPCSHPHYPPQYPWWWVQQSLPYYGQTICQGNAISQQQLGLGQAQWAQQQNQLGMQQYGLGQQGGLHQ